MPKKTLTPEEAKAKYEKQLERQRESAKKTYNKWKDENADIIAEWNRVKESKRNELLLQREKIEKELKALRTNRLGTLKKFVKENGDSIRKKIQRGAIAL